MVFDEFDKVSDKNIKQNVLFFSTAVQNLTFEEKTVPESRLLYGYIEYESSEGKSRQVRGSEPLHPQVCVADTEYVETELRECWPGRQRDFWIEGFSPD